MKKILLASILSLFCAASMANDRGPTVTTVEKAKSMRDDSRVTLEGKITSRAGDDDEEYWFADSTGQIRINVDDDDDEDNEGHLVGKKVRITGDVDRDDGRSEIDVDRLRVIR